MGVKQLLAEMLQMPLLGSSIFAITSQAAAKAENVSMLCKLGYAAMLSASELCLSRFGDGTSTKWLKWNSLIPLEWEALM